MRWWILLVAAALAGCGSAAVKTVTKTASASGASQTVTETITETNPGQTTAGGTDTFGDTGGTGNTGNTGSGNTGNTGSGNTGSIPSVSVGKSQGLQASQEGGETISTKVTGVKDLAPDEFDTPDSGKHYVGVYMTYHNTGSATFNDSPDNEVTLVTNKNNTIDNDGANLGDCTNNGQVTVGAGQTINSCVTFQEPNDQTVKFVQVSLDSGNDPPGDWTP